MRSQSKVVQCTDRGVGIKKKTKKKNQHDGDNLSFSGHESERRRDVGVSREEIMEGGKSTERHLDEASQMMQQVSGSRGLGGDNRRRKQEEENWL